jgi:uncharacterized protein (DUF433 family)
VRRACHNRGVTQREYVEERNGGFFVKGTRITLDSIAHAFREGESPETILENFDTLTLEHVYGAITFYLANQPEIDAYLVRQQQRIDSLKRQAQPLPSDLRSRLESARERLHSGTSE